jgi:exosortase
LYCSELAQLYYLFAIGDDSFQRTHMNRKLAVALALLLGSFALLFSKVGVDLVNDWSADGNYSHGFLIIPIAVFFVWERRRKLLGTPVDPSSLGLVIVLVSMGLLSVGLLGFEFFLTRLSILGVLVGAVLFLLGWAHLRILFFPISFLLLMIPIPAIVFNQIAFPLQLLASQFGEMILMALRVPVLREGNVIFLANTTLEVAEACSGIRSLVSLLTLGIVYGYLVDSRIWMRTALALITIPIAILVNALRVTGTGLAASHYGPEVAEGFFHSFSGWLMFVVAFVALYVTHRIINWISRSTVGEAQQPSKFN